jgi:hypothetical protein
MARERWFLALGLLAFATPACAVSPVGGLGQHDCIGSPDKAVTILPLPLSKWGSIACTPYGHILTSHDGWIWLMPDRSDTVFIPSQLADSQRQMVGNDSYFTTIEVMQVRGQESDEAYTTFHVGFDERESKPDIYRVDLVSVSGKTMRLFFFDYDTYAWGMTCPENKCQTDTRFMVLDKNHRPEPRKPPI